MRCSLFAFAIFGALVATGCGADDLDVEDGEGDRFPDGKADGAIEDGSAEARGVLALVNDRAVDTAELDVDAGLSARAAANIIKHRDGADRLPGTADDDAYDDLAELDAIAYVGAATLNQLLAYATETGRVTPAPTAEVVFSPQPAATSHTKRVAAWIRGAQRTVDIAMYSYSDADVQAALLDARARGVVVRFLFDTASEDRKLDAAGRAASKSGKLEAAGIDVRWVNKILHHKVAILDGERVITGSGNWSYGGAQIYDENTVFVSNAGELAGSYQREFDHLWNHSRDFALAAALPFEQRAVAPAVDTDPDAAAYFTSANFTVPANGNTFRVDRESTAVSDVLVAAILGAQRSVHVSSGHLRLRPVAEALIAIKRANPALDVRVYLDQQEFISASGHAAQLAELEACLAAATTDTQRWNCTARDFLFSKQVADAGVALRVKAYAYRWDYSYALQMHHKFIVVDGTDLFTGSYNLSMNAEQATFENVLHLRGATYAAIVAAFEREFDRLWTTGRSPDLLAGLRTQIATAAEIPLVFPSMALTWQELSDLRALIRANCAVVDSDEYRANAAAHRTCPR